MASTLLTPPSKRAEASAAEAPRSWAGLTFRRVFTRPDQDPFDSLEWELRDAIVTDADGETVFEQRGVEVPSGWSERATNVVVSKYFRGSLESEERETSIRQLIARVVDTLTGWGRSDSFFSSDEDADTFQAELSHVLLHQMASFNSPVWFNLGIVSRPQCSACFINAVEDCMPSILDLAKTEAMLFKHGSGTGTNLSTLRSSRERLSGGGMASGPVSFMKGFDAFAGVIKSGGRTRRAAKMAILGIDHPDILPFIRSKRGEEAKARALIEAGWAAGFDAEGGAYDSVSFQNANHTIRVDDVFMRAVEEDDTWTTHAVTDGCAMDTHPARELFRAIAEAAWTCGDPGLQYDDAINAWHTCPRSGRIEASNPCSEFLFLDDSACNLASINLACFDRIDPAPSGIDPGYRTLDIEGFRQACRLMISAQDLIVHHAGYPRPAIERDTAAPAASTGATHAFVNQQDAPPCHVCGLIMVRRGACYQCLNCGATSGCG